MSLNSFSAMRRCLKKRGFKYNQVIQDIRAKDGRKTVFTKEKELYQKMKYIHMLLLIKVKGNHNMSQST
jgi:hypothetical protein